MPPFQRYRRWYWRRYYRPQKRRVRFRRRGLRKTFPRTRKRRRVRRKLFTKRYKKLKTINLRQWQPNHIKKCKITGFLQLFGAGLGRFSNNFTPYKESWVPPHEPGGGGWGLQQFTLSNLYAQNSYLMNWWTKSNKGLNLCRYLGAEFKLYRQQQTDYIFTYEIEGPYDEPKYYYPSFHPMRLLNFNKKVIVPSFKTMPLLKKTHKKLKIKPSKELKNQWYFQQNLAPYTLVKFAAVACSLNSMFQPTNQLNNNCSVYYIDTTFFQNPQFQFTDANTWGYQPKENTYIYGLPQASPTYLDTPLSLVVYLGNTYFHDQGETMGGHVKPLDQTSSKPKYTKNKWGNPFYYRYYNGDYPVFISQKDPGYFLDKLNEKASTKLSEVKSYITFKTDPFIQETRYNPNYDKGNGNVAYWIRNDDVTQKNYEPTKDPDLKIENFPLWILLWGFEDYTKKIGKTRYLSQNWMLVIRTNSLPNKSPAYVIVSDSFYRGQGPYNVDYSELPTQDIGHWYPRWRYQKEGIEAILETGPAVCKSESQKSIQAHLKYRFFFKWGGNPSSMESVYDPNSQPTYPTPNNQYFQNEISNPTESISTFIYNWDTRRDYLTQNAAKRITDISLYDPTLFADGAQHSTEIPLQISEETQEKKTQKEQEETLLQLLFKLQQQNSNLRDRYRQLTTIVQNM
nr:MAG: ORF1 [TTV-like mini virus]